MRNLIMVFFLLSSVALFAKEELFVSATYADLKPSGLSSEGILGADISFKADKKQGALLYYLDLRARYSRGDIQTISNTFKELEGVIGVVYAMNNDLSFSGGLGIGSFRWEIGDFNNINWHPFLVDLHLGYEPMKSHSIDLRYRFKYSSHINNETIVNGLEGKLFGNEIGIDYLYNFYPHYDLLLGYEYTQYNNNSEELFHHHLIKLGIGYRF